MDAGNARLDRNINRILKDIRVFARQMQEKIDADKDCSTEARLLMHAQADLRMFLQRREEAT